MATALGGKTALVTGVPARTWPPPTPGRRRPLHNVAIVRLGMPLIDAANVEELPAVRPGFPR